MSGDALPDLPRAITSFGAAALGDALYVYGGHYGKAHHYYHDGQSGDLLQLRPDQRGPGAGWEAVATGPRLQGLQLLACRGRVIRVGGFVARNAIDADQDLHSTDEVAAWDPATGAWSALPALPAGRSSFGGDVLDDKLYVVGGWQLRGAGDPHWHDHALCFDPAADQGWRTIASPPCQRRALAAAAHQGRLYAIGGMLPDDGKVTGRCDIYDPASNAWSPGPDLPGEDMEGFGCAARSLGGNLYVSTSSGNLWQLAGEAWQLAQRLRDGRFFHQALPWGAGLAILGGANMQTGKFARGEFVAL